mgnify:CR=1 FL=1
MKATGPAVAVAVNVTGASPGTVAVAWLATGVVPRVQPTWAIPEASVRVETADTEPAPGATSHCTATPARGFPVELRTTTTRGEGSVEPTVPLWPSPLTAATEPAGVAPPEGANTWNEYALGGRTNFTPLLIDRTSVTADYRANLFMFGVAYHFGR